MEAAEVSYTLSVDKRSQSRGKATQEVAIFFAVRIGLPAEDALFFSVNFGDYLRRMLRAPLGKQMRHFEIFDSAASAHIYPSVELVEAELVAVLCLFDIDKLNGRSLSPDFGIKRRSKKRSKNEIDSVIRGVPDIVFNYIPVLFAENIDFIICRKAVAVKPHSAHKFLLRKLCVDNIDSDNIRDGLFAF